MGNPSISKITSSHFHAWEKGLKTLCYYVRTKAISTGAKHLAVDISKVEKPKTIEKPKVDFSKIKMTTEGMGSGNVEYFVNIPFVSVNNKCEARTGFGHVGGWNHPPELDNRKKEILSYIPNGENENVVVDNKLDISQLTRTAEGLQEYWIQWRHRHYQNDCKNNTSQNTNQQTNTQLVIKGSGLTDLREKIRLRTQNISINPNQFGSLDLSTYTLTLNPGPQKVQKVTLVWSNISEEDLKQRWVNNFEKENPTIESLGELQTTIINDITFYCHLAYIPA
jgi:hypothetical protein